MSYRNKIIVIADDFTGAAEIGGIGLRHGLKVLIETEPVKNTEADLFVIATDTRSMNKNEASKYITELTSQLMQLNPRFIYKKIDSVFRGNISEELVAQLIVMRKSISVIIAANPIFNRIIKDGKYFIDGIPLDQTCFSNDSQYPIKSPDVLSLVSKIDNFPVVNLKPENPFPENGLVIGDCENRDDLDKWALRYNENILFAGASGFFDSLLHSLFIYQGSYKAPVVPFGENALFVLGSSYPKDAKLLTRMVEHGHYFSNMPVEIYENSNYLNIHLDTWINEIVAGLKMHKKVIIASMHKGSTEPGISFRIKQVIAEVVKKVSERIKLNEILIEGGSTTSEILNYMNIKKLIPVHELDTGVIRMKAEGFENLCITTKPGSYLWPENVWLPSEIDNFNNKKFEFWK